MLRFEHQCASQLFFRIKPVLHEEKQRGQLSAQTTAQGFEVTTAPGCAVQRSMCIAFFITKSITHTCTQGPRFNKIIRFHCLPENSLKLVFFGLFSSFKLKKTSRKKEVTPTRTVGRWLRFVLRSQPCTHRCFYTMSSSQSRGKRQPGVTVKALRTQWIP